MNSTLIEFQRRHPKMAKAIADRGFFLANAEELAALVLINRLCPVLVRCGNGRFTCPAQDVNHFVRIINNDPKGTDYVRDISIILK